MEPNRAKRLIEVLFNVDKIYSGDVEIKQLVANYEEIAMQH